MPEATIHEDDRASPWEDDIRFTRKIGAVRIRPVPKTSENLYYSTLRLCIPTPNT